MTKLEVLDHGYVQFIEDWGYGLSLQKEAGIIEAARMSTAKGFNGWDAVQCESCGLILQNAQQHTSEPGVFCKGDTFKEIGDKKLLSFLYKKKHMTPFEMAGMTIEVQAPIMVFREWHRHRTQSYNEMSGRYIQLPDVNYVPSIQRLMVSTGTTNKQAQSTGATLLEPMAQMFQIALQAGYDAMEQGYESALNTGVPKELARLFVTVGRYSRMRASGNLRNWLAFLTLRMDPDAQWEIRQYANLVGNIIAKQFPRTWELFTP